MRILAITTISAAALAVSACGSENAGEFTAEDGSTGEYAIDSKTGEASMTIDTPEGEASMRAGSTVEPNLPDGWTIYPGATIVNAINVDRADGSGAMVTMTSDAGSDAIIAHYRKQAETTGFPIDLELKTATSTVIGGEKADGSTFSVSVAPGAEGEPATVQLTLAEG